MALTIGGAPVVTITDSDPLAEGPTILSADILPGRGMMLLQARARLASGDVTDLLFAPPAEQASAELNGGPDDFAGNKAFAYGGAILVPFANRIRGRALDGSREIEAEVGGKRVRLPRNWGGRAEGAEQYAMHGLILDRSVPFEQPGPDRLQGRLAAGDFDGRWPGQTELSFEWRLAAGELTLRIEARNRGDAPLPMGIGWHPYFALPSGQRAQGRMRLAAARRTEVADYDAVLPTGRLLANAGSDYDFSAPDGAALGDLYLDDCFVDLQRERGEVVVEVLDPAADLAVRVASPSPAVQAVQVYAPPDKAFVVVEPQFNVADPFGKAWSKEFDTGMARIAPGEAVAYEARVSVSTVGNRLRI